MGKSHFYEDDQMPLGQKSFFTQQYYQNLKIKMDDLSDCDKKLVDGTDHYTQTKFALYSSNLSCHSKLHPSLEKLCLLTNKKVEVLDGDNVAINGPLGKNIFVFLVHSCYLVQVTPHPTIHSVKQEFERKQMEKAPSRLSFRVKLFRKQSY